jgi:hypothetical protein
MEIQAQNNRDKVRKILAALRKEESNELKKKEDLTEMVDHL